jgi:hypothetical protein
MFLFKYSPCCYGISAKDPWSVMGFTKVWEKGQTIFSLVSLNFPGKIKYISNNLLGNFSHIAKLD